MGTTIEKPTIGIKDEPNPGSERDMLEIGRHSNALVQFIQATETPMTMNWQGWTGQKQRTRKALALPD